MKLPHKLLMSYRQKRWTECWYRAKLLCSFAGATRGPLRVLPLPGRRAVLLVAGLPALRRQSLFFRLRYGSMRRSHPSHTLYSYRWEVPGAILGLRLDIRCGVLVAMLSISRQILCYWAYYKARPQQHRPISFNIIIRKYNAT